MCKVEPRCIDKLGWLSTQAYSLLKIKAHKSPGSMELQSRHGTTCLGTQVLAWLSHCWILGQYPYFLRVTQSSKKMKEKLNCTIQML